MKPEHEALVTALKHAGKGFRNDAKECCLDAADAIVSLSAELARYREAPTVGYIHHTRTVVDFEATKYCYELGSGTELIVRPTEAK